MIDLLYENEEFKAYNTKGGNQYSNALETYLKFLHAKEILQKKQSQSILQFFLYNRFIMVLPALVNQRLSRI